MHRKEGRAKGKTERKGKTTEEKGCTGELRLPMLDSLDLSICVRTQCATVSSESYYVKSDVYTMRHSMFALSSVITSYCLSNVYSGCFYCTE